MDWETWLRSAAKRPSDTEDDKRDKTEREIRAALANYGPLNGKKYRIYVKGSYANNTNVRLNFDVDIAVEYDGFFYSDLVLDLSGHDKKEVDVVDSPDPYTVDEFKADIRGALEKAFGSSAVKAGDIAYRIREKKTTLPADVVPCFEYHRYDKKRTDGSILMHKGSCIWPKSGGKITNFPEQQLENGNDKNGRTGRRYKRMVRCLKKLQTRLVEAGTLGEELASYFVECLVYNVPDDRFGSDSYLTDMRSVLGCIWAATQTDGDWNDWEEVNGLKYLFRANPDLTRAAVHKLVDKAWDEIGIG